MQRVCGKCLAREVPVRLRTLGRKTGPSREKKRRVCGKCLARAWRVRLRTLGRKTDPSREINAKSLWKMFSAGIAGAASHTKLGRKNPLSAGLFNLNSEEALATTIHLRLLCPPVHCISRDLCHRTPCAGRSETSTPTTRCSRHNQPGLHS